MSAPKHVFLIDGSGFIFRAFYALPPLTRPDGTPINAVLGFVNMLMKMVADTDADHIAVVFDSGRRSFRNDIYPDYKANRGEPPEELVPQFDLVREATQAFNVACIERPGYEADDLIATYARQARAQGAEVTIVSSDKDLMQLVGDGITMFDPIKNRSIGIDGVMEKFGVGPDRVVDVQSLAGDSTDNVPGVPGIGLKTAALLINEFGDLDTLLGRAGEIKQPKRRQALLDHADDAYMSRDLVRLCDDLDLEPPIEDLEIRRPDPDILLPFLKEQGFANVLARVESQLLVDGHISAPSTATTVAPPGTASSYELVDGEDALDRWIARAFRAGVVAVDTETTSLDAMSARLVGVSLSLAAGEACYIPLQHVAPDEDGAGGQGALDVFGPEAAGTAQKAVPKKTKSGKEKADPADKPGDGVPFRQIRLDVALSCLKPLLEDPGVLKIGQNLKYDCLILARYGIDLAPLDDTMLLSYVLDGGAHGHGMDELARLHLGHETIKFKDVAGSGKTQITFDKVPLAEARDYAAEDADITLRLYRILKPRLLDSRLVTVYETLERPLVPVLAAMERQGVLVDKAVLAGLSKDFALRMAELEKDIHRLAGREFAVGSPKQLGEVLFDELGLEGGKKGKSGAYGTGAAVLEELAASGHDLPARVLDWRQLSKLKSTYTDALIQQINPETGRVHTSFALAATSTGRLASTDPNLQNIPIRTEEGRKIRHAFVAARGNTLLSVDYSQIELRLLAHVAEIDTLRGAFHKGLDIHALTASQVFGIPVDGMDPMLRRQAKAINFGIIYGISAFGLANQLGVPQAEAAAYIKAYFEQYPGIAEYMERTKAFARKHGFVTTIFGRRCFTPGIGDKNPNMRNFAERAAINAPLQGAAADIIRRAMIRIPAALAKKKLAAVMLLQVHDELLFEVPESEVEDTAATVKSVMENACGPALRLSVPLVAETGIGATWADAH